VLSEGAAGQQLSPPITDHIPAQVTDRAAARAIFRPVKPLSTDFKVFVWATDKKCPKLAAGTRLKIMIRGKVTPEWYLEQGKVKDTGSTWKGRSINVAVAAIDDPFFEDALKAGLEAQGYALVSDVADFTIAYDALDTYDKWLGQGPITGATAQDDFFRKKVQLWMAPGNLNSPEEVEAGAVWEGFMQGDLASYRGSPGLFVKPLLSRIGKEFKGQIVGVKHPKR
jgi:hypothetical protein